MILAGAAAAKNINTATAKSKEKPLAGGAFFMLFCHISFKLPVHIFLSFLWYFPKDIKDYAVRRKTGILTKKVDFSKKCATILIMV